MGLDLVKAFGWIISELAADRPAEDSMVHLIDQCAAARPHSDWQRLRNLPYSDRSSLSEWIEQPFRLHPPEKPLRGLWFGIFNPIYDGHATADFYISGSDRFDADPNDNGWAVGPVWRPKNRCARSEIMASIYRIAYGEGGLANEAEYPLCLAYAALIVRELLNGVDPQLILKTVGPVGVAVGFDSGDFILLGRFTNDGLAPL